MKAKKLIALLIFALMACVSLIGCEDEIGKYYYEVYEPGKIGVVAEKPSVELDFYIISEYPEGYGSVEEVTKAYDSTLATVKYNINLHLEEVYKTTLDIHFISEDEYAEKISSITAVGSKENKGIVLINSATMMDSLVAGDSLVDLTDYLSNPKYKFGTLNVQISQGLLALAMTELDNANRLYCIPNNHVIDMDAYDYIAINKDVALDLHFSLNQMKQMNSVDNEMLQQLVATATAAGINDTSSVYRVFYDEPYNYSNSDLKGEWVYNVMGVPTVTKEEAYSTAYGILSGTEDYDRAMEIIYALNTDIAFRNLLQYGVLNNHYEYITPEDGKIDEDAVYVALKSGSLYKMNIEYTGDVFKAYYTSEWTEKDAANGKQQNYDAVYHN